MTNIDISIVRMRAGCKRYYTIGIAFQLSIVPGPEDEESFPTEEIKPIRWRQAARGISSKQFVPGRLIEVERA